MKPQEAGGAEVETGRGGSERWADAQEGSWRVTNPISGADGSLPSDWITPGQPCKRKGGEGISGSLRLSLLPASLHPPAAVCKN